jgi:hypothetical protein
VRQGYALPSVLISELGFAPGPGSAPTFLAKGRTKGLAQNLKGGLTARQSLASHPAAKPELSESSFRIGLIFKNSGEAGAKRVKLQDRLDFQKQRRSRS